MPEETQPTTTPIPNPAPEPPDERTVYERVGGMAFFDELAERFYDGIRTDDLLRSMYLEADLGPARRRLALFMAQYWGGPLTYMEERGHPMLRLRHAPFAIGPEARDRWLVHMRAALGAMTCGVEERAAFEAYFAMAAPALQNQP